MCSIDVDNNILCTYITALTIMTVVCGALISASHLDIIFRVFGYNYRIYFVIRHFFKGAFAELRKATINFIMSVSSFVYSHGTTRLPLDGFSCNMIFVDSSKICRRSSVLIKIVTIVIVTRMAGTRREYLFILVIISRCSLLRMQMFQRKL
jgi:hypothetical protein